MVEPSWKIDRAATVDGLVSVKNLTYNPSTQMSAVGVKAENPVSGDLPVHHPASAQRAVMRHENLWVSVAGNTSESYMPYTAGVLADSMSVAVIKLDK